MGKLNVYIALPVMNESDNISSLLECLNDQNTDNFKVVVCVNQYDSWWNDKEKIKICHDNQKSLKLLRDSKDLDIHVIDKCSPGMGWTDKKGGVGWARKVIMDFVSDNADVNDIIISIDADTYYPPDYINSVVTFFKDNDSISGLSIPYYHKTNFNSTSRLILRYEIYMRYYLLNMIRINNPYCFTALGSAMACSVRAYRKSGGLTPVIAGEDFYFLQKLVKTGEIGLWVPTVAYPSSRFSDRVTFGTGPALIKGVDGDWSSYPHYHFSDFDKIENTFSLFGELFENNIATPMDYFLAGQSSSSGIWEPLRRNYKDTGNFIKACCNKVDGLRILQFLRKNHVNNTTPDEKIMADYLQKFYEDNIDKYLLEELVNLDYLKSDLRVLNELRDFLFSEELKIRESRFTNLGNINK